MNMSSNHGYPPESFSPETVDDEIARYLSTELQPGATTGDAHLIREIATYHTLPPEASATLARARARVRSSSETLGNSSFNRHGDTTMDKQDKGDVPQPLQPQRPSATPSSQPRRLTSLATPVRAAAAVLVVALLLGGFVAVLHLRGGRQSEAASTWQNVSITRTNTQGHTLDFDPAQVQVEYAVSDVDGTIYALGATHLWYSVNGGATYQPFAVSLPLVKSGPPYAISTVPGLRGVFLSGSGDNLFATISYAEVGDKSWRQLDTANVAQPVAQNGTSVAFDATNIGKAIFYEHGYGKSVQARAVGNWLFVLAQRSGGSGSTLVGTPDFGTKWYALSETLPGACTKFAVSPADARQLFCLTGSNTVEQTTDGGLTWNQMTNANGNAVALSTSIWASARAVYTSYTSALGTHNKTLVWHPIGAGNWSISATLPTLPEGGSSEIIGVSPDDTAYAIAAQQGSQTRVRISALAPGARQFTPLGNDATLTLPNSAIFFDLGDLYSGKAPAVYAHVAPAAEATGTLPLYRLALPQVTPFMTPTALPTATPMLQGPCTNTPGDVANIQSGGYGADFDTFAQRWGASDGVAAGSAYFGRWPDGTPKVQVADTLPSNHRVYAIGYHISQAQNMTQVQGEALATSILPKDAVQVGRSQQNNNITVTYCSAALIAAFPASVQSINGPLPHNGLVTVTYTLRSDGYLFGIDFGPQP